ncbi:hypothetical protein [Kibdelosporangium philippinense]
MHGDLLGRRAAVIASPRGRGLVCRGVRVGGPAAWPGNCGAWC